MYLTWACPSYISAYFHGARWIASSEMHFRDVSVFCIISEMGRLTTVSQCSCIWSRCHSNSGMHSFIISWYYSLVSDVLMEPEVPYHVCLLLWSVDAYLSYLWLSCSRTVNAQFDWLWAWVGSFLWSYLLDGAAVWVLVAQKCTWFI